MKMKGLLLYNISADKLKKIRVILLRLGLQGRVVTPEEFLLPVREEPEPAPGEILYTAVVSHLTASEAAMLKEVYPACEIREEAG